MSRISGTRVAASPRRSGGRAHMLAAALGVAAVAAVARPADDVVEDPPTQEQQASRQDNVVDLISQFDSNLFQHSGGWIVQGGVMRRPGMSPTGPDGDAASPALERARELAATRLQRVERTCAPTEEQVRKLRLALESDIRSFVTEVEAVRGRYVGATANMRDREGQRQWQRVQQDVQTCRRKMQGLFGPGSLFAAVLPTVLDEPQMATLNRETASRRSFRWRSIVSGTMLRLDDTVGFTQSQHDAITQLLLEREPPLVLDGRPAQRNPQAEQMLVFLVLSEVDERALKRVVDERQWPTLSNFVKQGRAMQSWLEGQGLVEKSP